MSGSELVHVIDLSIGGLIPMEAGTVPGSGSLFDVSDGIALEMSAAPERLPAAGCETCKEKEAGKNTKRPKRST
jgi:hypothetical protein